jgi:hypothetical protein
MDARAHAISQGNHSTGCSFFRGSDPVTAEPTYIALPFVLKSCLKIKDETTGATMTLEK